MSRIIYRRGALAYYLLASVQVFSGAIPFGDGVSSVSAMLAIVQGKRPQRPTHSTFTEDLWMLIQRCWNGDPHSRPKVSEVALQLLTLSVCNHLIGHASTTHEHVSLIGKIFSDNDSVTMVENFSRDDTQTLIDVVDEVNPRSIPGSKNRLIDLDSKPRVLLIRCCVKTVFRQRSVGSVCAIYIGFVATTACFRDR